MLRSRVAGLRGRAAAGGARRQRGLGQNAAPFTPASLPDLLLWLDAETGVYQDAAGTTPAVNDGDLVGLWQDQSGLGHHATSTTTARPALKLNQVNGLPALRFDGGDYLALGNPATLQVGTDDKVTIFCVYRSLDNNNVQDYLLGQNNVAGALHLRIYVALTGTNARDVLIPGVIVANNLGNPAIEGDITPYNVWEVLAYRRTGAGANTSGFWRNGIHMWMNTNAADSFTVHTDKYIGSRGTSGSFTGDMAAMLIFGRGLSLDEMDQMNDWLLSRFGVAGVDEYLWSTAPDFTVAFIPDAQFIAQDKPHEYPIMLQWLKRRQSELNLAAVLSEGDIVQTVGTAAEWTTVSNAYAILDAAGIPYLATPGNHDCDDGPTRDWTTYNTYFTQARYQARAGWNGGFQDASDCENAYMLLSAGGVDYLIIGLDYGPNQATIDWAASIIAANPTRDVIIVTHSYLEHDDTLTTTGDAYNPHGSMGAHPACHDGAEMWTELVKLYPNIVWVGSGHTYAAGPDGVGYLASAGDNGNTVHQHLANYQTYTGGVLGYLRLLQKIGNTVYCWTFSPTHHLRLADAANEFSVTYKP